MRESIIFLVSVFITSLLILRVIRIRRILRKHKKQPNGSDLTPIFLSSICSASAGVSAGEVIYEAVKEAKEEKKRQKKREGEQQRADDYASSISPIYPEFMQKIERKNEMDIEKISDVIIGSKEVTIPDILEQTDLSEMRIRHLLRFEMNYDIIDDHIVKKANIRNEDIDSERICLECGNILSVEDDYCSACGKTSLH